MVNFQIAEACGIDDLLKIMEILRAPGGCPWDQAQTHQSIRANLLEEAYETADAIDHMDMANLKEELGDVLLQVVFHARIAQESSAFTFDDVVDGVCRKLVYRHPHVFGTVDARDGSEALNVWDAQKRAEKGQKTAGDALDSVARALPALTRASKLQSKAATAGFDWEEVSPALDKLSEELEELKTAVREGSNVEEELGDLLFAAVNVARFVKVDPEAALTGATDKFIARFRLVEELARKEGKSMEDMDLEALDALWEQAKAALKQA